MFQQHRLILFPVSVFSVVFLQCSQINTCTCMALQEHRTLDVPSMEKLWCRQLSNSPTVDLGSGPNRVGLFLCGDTDSASTKLSQLALQQGSILLGHSNRFEISPLGFFMVLMINILPLVIPRLYLRVNDLILTHPSNENDLTQTQIAEGFSNPVISFLVIFNKQKWISLVFVLQAVHCVFLSVAEQPREINE